MEIREKKIYKVTLTGSIVNAVLIVLKFVAGFMGRSSALVADAVHSLTDFVTDVIVLIFVKISGKPQDKSHEYGHGKFETLATMVIGVILIIAGIGLGYSGVEKVIESLRGATLPEPTWIALAVAVISILSKELLYRYTIRAGNQLKSDALVANAWHHRSDAISSFGTLVGIGGSILLGEKWRILDPLAAALVSVFIIKAGYDILKPCIAELLESSLPDDQENLIADIIRQADGALGFHNLRTRKVGSGIVIDVHVKMDGNLPLVEAHDIATHIECEIKRHFGQNTIINIHMEPLRHS